MGAIGLSIEQLLLDSQNPRIGSASNQRQVFQELLDDQKDKLFNLASDIVDEGMSPIERILVIRDSENPEHHIVLEGNRRVAALKILANPTVLDSLSLPATLKRRFQNLARNFDGKAVEQIDCYELDSRDDAIHWLQLRHTGENEGSGVVGWSGIAASKFRGNNPALQALEFVKIYGNLTVDQKARIGNYFPITTLERLLSSRDVRQRVGLEVKDNKLWSRLPADEVVKPLRKMVLDLALKNVNVSQLKNSSQQVGYVESFDASSRPDLSKIAALRPIEEIKETDFATRPSRRVRSLDSSPRKTIVPRGFRLNVTDNKTATIFKELKTLRLDEFNNATAVLLRVFLELSVDSYMEQHSLQRKHKDPRSNRLVDKSLRKKVEDVVNDLVQRQGCDKKDFFGVIRGLSVAHSPLYIDLLNAYVHNRFVTPKTGDLIGAWDDAQRFFERVWP